MSEEMLEAQEGAQRIDMFSDEDVQRWMHALGCTHEELSAAVREVGNRVDDVKKYVKAPRITHHH